MKKRLLFVITQFYKGGAEMALLRLFQSLSPREYEIDFLITDQMELRDARTLTDQIPPWIHVYNAAGREGKFAVVKKAWFKAVRRLAGRQMFRKSALRFVKGKTYDAAFSYGEWMPPAFVACHVRADKKMLWIHTDIDKAKSVKEDILFGYDQVYDTYIFVSEHSRKCAQERFPVCVGKSAVVHNMCADAVVRAAAGKACTGMEGYPRPWLLSVGNLREEKNYPRQIEIMHILKERGVKLTWFCIGSRANPVIDRQIRMQVKHYGLEDCFLLLGVQDNPYPYMKQADAVMSLSDFESWSLVITEAKLLGVPVVATPTSGATEQLADGKTGVIVPFEPKAAADKIQWFLENKNAQNQIRKNLRGFSTNEPVMEEFRALFDEPAAFGQAAGPYSKRILYLFDDINYPSGARRAAFYQIKRLRRHCRIHIFSLSRPHGKKETGADHDLHIIRGIPVLGRDIWPNYELAARPFQEVMCSRNIPIRNKIKRAWYAAVMRSKKSDVYMKRMLGQKTIQTWERYDAVIIVSEASKLRGVAACLKHPKKIQWIHTDYAPWSRFSGWTRAVTANDARLYQNFDRVVSLSRRNRQGFVQLYPHLKEKTAVVPNFIDGRIILQKAGKRHTRQNKTENGLRLISIGRADQEKGYDSILDICKKMQKEGCRFLWYIVGDGPLLSHLKKRIRTEGLSGCVRLTGWLENPYPLMQRCDWLVLLSDYEGTPVTVDEAMVLGLPVAAVDAGGIREQLERGKKGQYGYTEKKEHICHRICEMIRNGERKSGLELYDYETWNQDVQKRLLELMEMDDML